VSRFALASSVALLIGCGAAPSPATSEPAAVTTTQPSRRWSMTVKPAKIAGTAVLRTIVHRLRARAR
jgi:hypothetical protein